MKKLILGLLFLTVSIVSAQYKNTVVVEIAKGSFNLERGDSVSTTGRDSLFILSSLFVIEADTLSFVLEVQSSQGAIRYDTLLANSGNRLLFQRPKADSIGALVKIQSFSPSGVADTTSWTNCPTVVTKTALTGPVVFGTPYAKTSSELHAKAAILLWNGHLRTAVTGTYKLYVIRKFIK